VWALAAFSSLLELGYFISLSTAYRRGDLSLVYPVARGSAALLAVPTGILILGERLTPLEAAGVACLLLGIFVVRRPSGSTRALIPALLTGVFISGYQAIDRVGVRIIEPWLYGWIIWVFTAILLIAWLFATSRVPHDSANEGGQRARFLHQVVVRPSSAEESEAPWTRSALIGTLMIVAYVMVLGAYSIAPLAVVAPLRESAIVLVTVWGVWKLREVRGAAIRLAGATIIVAGVAMLAL
jgi:drug/metabolite transporter (DMT)-like permease